GGTGRPRPCSRRAREPGVSRRPADRAARGWPKRRSPCPQRRAGARPGTFQRGAYPLGSWTLLHSTRAAFLAPLAAKVRDLRRASARAHSQTAVAFLYGEVGHTSVLEQPQVPATQASLP